MNGCAEAELMEKTKGEAPKYTWSIKIGKEGEPNTFFLRCESCQRYENLGVVPSDAAHVDGQRVWNAQKVKQWRTILKREQMIPNLLVVNENSETVISACLSFKRDMARIVHNIASGNDDDFSIDLTEDLGNGYDLASFMENMTLMEQDIAFDLKSKAAEKMNLSPLDLDLKIKEAARKKPTTAQQDIKAKELARKQPTLLDVELKQKATIRGRPTALDIDVKAKATARKQTKASERKKLTPLEQDLKDKEDARKAKANLKKFY